MRCCSKKKIVGVSVCRGIAGYGSDGVFHALYDMIGECIVILSDVNVIKYTHRDAAFGLV